MSLKIRIKKGPSFDGHFGKTVIVLGILRLTRIVLLQDFLYEAIFIPEGVAPPERNIIEQPELKLYYEDFGSGKADHCIVADDNGKVVGAAWTRIMNDYGHIDEETPSFAISLGQITHWWEGTNYVLDELCVSPDCHFSEKGYY